MGNGAHRGRQPPSPEGGHRLHMPCSLLRPHLHPCITPATFHFRIRTYSCTIPCMTAAAVSTLDVPRDAITFCNMKFDPCARCPDKPLQPALPLHPCSCPLNAFSILALCDGGLSSAVASPHNCKIVAEMSCGVATQLATKYQGLKSKAMRTIYGQHSQQQIAID